MSKCCAEVELGKWPQRDWTDLDPARSQLATVTTKADLLAALQFSLFLWSNPVALFASFDPVCLCFPFPSPPPHPRLQDARLTLQCSVLVSQLLAAPFPSPLLAGTLEAGHFVYLQTTVFRLPPSPKQLAIAPVGFSSQPSLTNSTPPLPWCKTSVGSLPRLAKNTGGGAFNGPFFATTNVNANLWGDGNSNIMRY